MKVGNRAATRFPAPMSNPTNEKSMNNDDSGAFTDVNARKPLTPPEVKISFLRVWKNSEAKPRTGGTPWCVEFEVSWSGCRSTILIEVSGAIVDEADIIRVGRSHLNVMADDLAAKTQAWRLKDAELRSLFKG